ncbi:unnamed protein product, partial [Lampetra planeri]
VSQPHRHASEDLVPESKDQVEAPDRRWPRTPRRGRQLLGAAANFPVAIFLPSDRPHACPRPSHRSGGHVLALAQAAGATRLAGWAGWAGRAGSGWWRAPWLPPRDPPPPTNDVQIKVPSVASYGILGQVLLARCLTHRQSTCTGKGPPYSLSLAIGASAVSAVPNTQTEHMYRQRSPV